MDDLEKYIEKRKAKSREFADGFKAGYVMFKKSFTERSIKETADKQSNKQRKK